MLAHFIPHRFVWQAAIPHLTTRCSAASALELGHNNTNTPARNLALASAATGSSHLLTSGEEMALGSSAAGTAGTACASPSSSADGARLLSDAALAVRQQTHAL